MEMAVAGRGAVGHQRDRQVGSVAGVIQHLDVEHRGQSAETLGTDAQRVDLFHQFEAQFFRTRQLGAGGGLGFQFVNVDRRHDRFLGQQHGFFRRAADADADDAGRAPAGTHFRDLVQNPVDEVVGRVEHGELRFGFRTAALGGTDDFDVMTGNEFEMDDSRRVVLGVLAGAGRVGEHRGAQRIVRVAVGATDAFVDHLLDAHRGVRPGDLHADLDEDHADAGVLADRTMPFGGHPRVGQDLGDRVLGSRRLFALVGFTQSLDVIQRVIVADVLESIGDGLDQVFLFDGGHVQLRN